MPLNHAPISFLVFQRTPERLIPTRWASLKNSQIETFVGIGRQFSAVALNRTMAPLRVSIAVKRGFIDDLTAVSSTWQALFLFVIGVVLLVSGALSVVPRPVRKEFVRRFLAEQPHLGHYYAIRREWLDDQDDESEFF